MDLASSSDIVKCPVCQTVPRDKIFLCENDHSICEGCYDDLPFRVQETTIGRVIKPLNSGAGEQSEKWWNNFQASSVVRWQDWGREDQLVKVCPKGKCCYSDPPKRSFKEEEAVEAATDLTFSCKYRVSIFLENDFWSNMNQFLKGVWVQKVRQEAGYRKAWVIRLHLLPTHGTMPYQGLLSEVWCACRSWTFPSNSFQ